MKVSVIIPVFNDPRLEKCLAALAAQTMEHGEFEVIVVDNGSKESPQAVVDRYPFARLVSEATPGSYAARNRALPLAVGEVIAFTDSDCVPANNWLATGYAAVTESTTPRLVGGRVQVFPAEANWPNAAELYDMAIAFDQERTIRELSYAVTANLFAPRAAFDVVGTFNQELMSGGDGEWCQRAAALGIPIVYCPEAWVAHPARASLDELFRKARRVVGGRHQRTRRSVVSLDFWKTALRFLFPDVGQFARGRRRLRESGYRGSAIRLAGVMTIIHYVKVWEYFSVRLGGKLERR